jgi:hypothetical protein
MTATDDQVEGLARWLHGTLAESPDARPLDWEDLDGSQAALYFWLARALLTRPPPVLLDVPGGEAADAGGGRG